MIKTVTVTNYLGESLTLELSNPFDIGINVRSIEGIGPPKGNVNYTEIASGDGGQFNSARASIRNITMQLGLMPVPTVEEARHRVYKYFPLDQQVTLRFETDKRLCEITGWVEECEPDIFSDDEVIDISIVCPDPYFYSVDSQLGTVNFSGVVDEFEFPFENSPDNESKIAVMTMAARANSSHEMMLEDYLQTGIVDSDHNYITSYGSYAVAAIEISDASSVEIRWGASFLSMTYNFYIFKCPVDQSATEDTLQYVATVKEYWDTATFSIDVSDYSQSGMKLYLVVEVENSLSNAQQNAVEITLNTSGSTSTPGDVPEFDSIIQDAYELRNVIGTVGVQAFNVNNVYPDKQWVVENGVIRLKDSPGKCCAKELFYYPNSIISRGLQFKTTSSSLKATYVSIKSTSDPEIYTETSGIGPEGDIKHSSVYPEAYNFTYYFVNFNEDDMSVLSSDVMICYRGNSVNYGGEPDPDIYYDYEPFDISDWEETPEPDPEPDPEPEPEPEPDPEPGEDNGFPDPPGEYPLYPTEVDQADTTNQYIEFASLVYRQEENVPYDGDVPTGVVMRLHATGEVRNITIYNMNTRERIVISTDRIEAITGHDFNTGDDIIITTTRGSKSIEYIHEGISYNILNALEKDTDWFMLSKGDNVFAYICEYGTEDLQFRLEYPTLYWGI